MNAALALVSPIAAHAAHISAAYARREPHLDALPPEPCHAVSPPPGEHLCHFDSTHSGPHSWQRLG